jgi:NAD(P)-dependent dehydrogenase (short-subunit alcohol dehydrogenase family)
MFLRHGTRSSRTMIKRSTLAASKCIKTVQRSSQVASFHSGLVSLSSIQASSKPQNELFRRPTRSLKGRVAIITGAGAIGDGIGNARAAAIMLAEDGCNVVCVDKDKGLAQRTVEMIEAEGKGKAIAIAADVTQEKDCEGIVQSAAEEYGRIDILFNCVGIGGAHGTAVDVDMVQWAKGLEINISTMVVMSKYVIPEMMKNDRSAGYTGSIINMASVAGLKGGTPHLLYPTSKGAIVNMTRAMAAHHAPAGIRVNCICPGMVYTPMMYAKGMTEEAREARKNRNLLKTEGNGWDVGAAVRYLAGDEARWLTGVILPIDAGATAAVGTELKKGTSV